MATFLWGTFPNIWTPIKSFHYFVTFCKFHCKKGKACAWGMDLMQKWEWVLACYNGCGLEDVVKWRIWGSQRGSGEYKYFQFRWGESEKCSVLNSTEKLVSFVLNKIIIVYVTRVQIAASWVQDEISILLSRNILYSNLASVWISCIKIGTSHSRLVLFFAQDLRLFVPTKTKQ